MRFAERTDRLWTELATSGRVSGAVSGVLNFLLPPACAACGGDAGAESHSAPVCLQCRLSLPPVPHPLCGRCGAPVGTGRAPSCLECAEWPDLLSGARAACLLESPARELVHALKYQGWKRVGAFMGKEMARRAAEVPVRADFVVPVPTSARNLRRRGYNQAEVIARSLAESAGIPPLRCLERHRQAGTQTSLNPAQRRANVSGAFALSERHRESVRSRRLILVDDVITTGATLLAAVQALSAGGASSVFAYAFARTVPISAEPKLDDGAELPFR